MWRQLSLLKKKTRITGKKDKECYECKACKHRTTLKSGTVLHKSKLPYRYCFIAMHLLTSTKKSFSAKEIPKERIGEDLPWVHIAISNAKRQLLNSYHSIKPEFLRPTSTNSAISLIEDISEKHYLEDF